jgi:hypothetical protein
MLKTTNADEGQPVIKAFGVVTKAAVQFVHKVLPLSVSH